MSALVMVNGCFDGLHPGHIRLLEYASYYGRVHVAINSDDSVRRLKGAGRPIFSEAERAYMLRAVRHVTGVYVFHGDTPEDAIETLQPDVIVVGYDHSTTDPHYQRVTRQTAILQAPKFEDYSTTGLVQRVREAVA